MKSFVILLAALLVVLLSSCVSTRYPEPTSAEIGMGKSLRPPKGKSLILVYRKSEGLHSRMIPSRVHLDGQIAGYCGVGTFIALPVTPGKHWVYTGMGRADGSLPRDSGVPVHAAEGGRVFVRVAVKDKVTDTVLIQAGGAIVPAPIGGFSPNIDLVSDGVGLKEAAKCKQHGAGPDIEVKAWP